MRFLVVTKSREGAPPEMAVGMMQMMQGWLAEHRASGKLEQTWSFAGVQGGGGILDVDSLEELDSIMAGFPFGQISTVEVYPLADLDAALTDQIAKVQAVLEAMGGG